VFFVATFHGHPIGIELAVVFLIFTSTSWNMAFGVYESLTTIPQDLEAAAASFGLTGWLRFRFLAFPCRDPETGLQLHPLMDERLVLPGRERDLHRGGHRIPTPRARSVHRDCRPERGHPVHRDRDRGA